MAKPRTPSWLDRAAAELTPGLWRLHVVGDGVDDYCNWPDDGDYRAAVLDAFGPGVWRVRLERRSGRNTADERRRLKLPAKADWLEIVVEDAPRREASIPLPDREVPAPFEPIPTDEDADEAVRRELRETARIEAECSRVEAEAKLRRLKAGLDGTATPPDSGIAEMMRQQAELVREMLRESRERESRLLAELGRRSTPAPEQAAGLVGLRESLGLVREVMSMADSFRGEAGGAVDDAGDGAAGSIIKVLREARGLLGAIPQRVPMQLAGPRAAPAQAPVAAPAAAPAPAGAGPAAPAEAAARRVRAFVQQLIEELTVGSEAESVADELASSVGLLPGPIRQALDAGSWRQAWQAILPYIGNEDWNQVDGFLASSPASVEWLDKFTASLKGADDGNEE